MGYNETTYWSERFEPSKEKGISADETEFIKSSLTRAKMVLDYGVGLGRYFPLYKGKTVTGVDIVDIRKEKLLENAALHDIEFDLKVKSSPGAKIKSKIKQYDLAVCCHLLLHQSKESYVRKIMTEMAEISKKVVIVSFYNPEKTKLAPHCFNYDYVSICKDLGFTVKKKAYIDQRVYLIYSK